MVCELLQELRDALLPLLDRVRVFLLEGEELFFGRQHWNEEAWVLAVDTHSEQIEITVSPFNLNYFTHAGVALEP